MASAEETVVFPLKTRMGLLVLLALGRMVSASCAWDCSSGAKESNVAATTKALNVKPLRFAGGGGGGGTLWFHDVKKSFVQSFLKIIYAFKKTILARICQLKNEKSLLVFRFFARGEHFAPWREGAPCWNCEIREGVGNGDPYGNRTRVTAVKGRCPGPLDERVAERGNIGRRTKLSRKNPGNGRFSTGNLPKEGAQNIGLASISKCFLRKSR